jgi:hypothetical protein
MTSKLEISRHFNPTSQNNTNGGGTVSYTFKSVVLTGGGAQIKLYTFLDRQVNSNLFSGLTQQSINSSGVIYGSNLYFAMNTQGLTIANNTVLFNASGGSLTVTYTYTRSNTYAILNSFVRGTDFDVNLMTPEPPLVIYSDNLSITQPNDVIPYPFPSRTYPIYIPGNIPVYVPNYLDVVAVAQNDVPLNHGGNPFTITASPASGVSIRDNQDGTYRFFFTPTQTGTCVVSPKIYGQFIRDCPVTYTVI